MYPCEACDRLTTNLFSISRVMKNPHNNNAATKTLEDIIAPKRCQQEPATKGNSKHAKNATRQITEHTVKNTTAEVFYLFAAPTIIEEQRACCRHQPKIEQKTKKSYFMTSDKSHNAQTCHHHSTSFSKKETSKTPHPRNHGSHHPISAPRPVLLQIPTRS